VVVTHNEVEEASPPSLSRERCRNRPPSLNFSELSFIPLYPGDFEEGCHRALAAGRVRPLFYGCAVDRPSAMGQLTTT
jgi:hypothetical protein